MYSMANQKEEYENLRECCIASFSKVYKDSLAFDMNKVPKEIRIIMTEDPYYKSETCALKAELYAKNLKTLDKVIAGEFGLADKDPTASVLRALEMKNKILFSDLMIDADDSNALNITMAFLSAEQMEALEQVEVMNQGSSTANLSSMKSGNEEAEIKVAPSSERYGEQTKEISPEEVIEW